MANIEDEPSLSKIIELLCLPESELAKRNLTADGLLSLGMSLIERKSRGLRSDGMATYLSPSITFLLDE